MILQSNPGQPQHSKAQQNLPKQGARYLNPHVLRVREAEQWMYGLNDGSRELHVFALRTSYASRRDLPSDLRYL